MNKKVAAPVQKTEINGRGDPLRCPRDTHLSANVGTNFGGRSVGIVRSRTKATEFFYVLSKRDIENEGSAEHLLQIFEHGLVLGYPHSLKMIPSWSGP